MLKNLKNKKKGFTLIELIIVIAIIAILAAIAIPKFGEVRKNAALKSDVANAKTIANAATYLISEGTLNDGTYYVDETKDEGNEIEQYLQNSPSPKSTGYGVFKVVVEKGDVTITMQKDQKTDTPSTDLFPVAADEVTEEQQSPASLEPSSQPGAQ